MKKNTLTEALERYGIYDGCKFRISESEYNPYTFSDGYIRDRNGDIREMQLFNILAGKVDVTVLPWEPKLGDIYWRYGFQNKAYFNVWEGNIEDYICCKAGNFARTKAELLSRKDEIMREIGMIE